MNLSLTLALCAISSLMTSCEPSIRLTRPVPSKAGIRVGNGVAVISNTPYSPYAKVLESSIERKISSDRVFPLLATPSSSDFVIEISNAYIEEKGEYCSDKNYRKDFDFVADVKVVNNHSGTIPFAHTYKARFSERVNRYKKNVTATADEIPYKRVTTDLLSDITPHNDTYYVSVSSEKKNPLLTQSVAFANCKNWNEATRLAKQVLRENPRESEAYFVIAISQREQGDFNGAIKTFNKAISINPKSKYYKELDNTQKINYNRHLM